MVVHQEYHKSLARESRETTLFYWKGFVPRISHGPKSCESLWLCYPKTPRWDSCDEIPLPSRGLPTNLWVHHWRWMWSTSLLVLFTWCHGRQMTKLYKIPQDHSNCHLSLRKRWFNLPFFGVWNNLVAIDLRTSNRRTVDKLQAFDPRIQFCPDVIRVFWESWDFTTGKFKISIFI